MNMKALVPVIMNKKVAPPSPYFRDNSLRSLSAFFILIFFALFLTACGGGGDSNSSTNGIIPSGNFYGGDNSTVEVQGRLALDVSNDTNEFTVFNSNQSSIPSSSGDFSVAVSKDSPTFTYAISESGKKVYATVSTNSDESITINAQSTAEAMVLLNPLLIPRTREERNKIIEIVKTNDSVKELATTIDVVYGSVEEPLSDERIINSLTNAVESILITLQASNTSLEKSLNYPIQKSVALVRAISTTNTSPLQIINNDMGALTLANSSGQTVKLELNNTGPAGITTNVDWVARIVELDPEAIRWAQSGDVPLLDPALNDIDSLIKPGGFDQKIIVEGTVGSGLLSLVVDPIGKLADSLNATVFPENGIVLPNDGVYAIVALSGSPFSDSAELASVKNSTWQHSQFIEAAAINIISTVVDVVGVGTTFANAAGIDIPDISLVLVAELGIIKAELTDNPSYISTAAISYFIGKVVDIGDKLLDYLRPYIHGSISNLQSTGLKRFFHIAVNTAKSVVEVWSGTVSISTRILNSVFSVTPRESGYAILGTFSNQTDPTSPAEINTFILSLNSSGSGSGAVAGIGINCPVDCSEAYPNGTNVILTASTASGSVFVGWNGCTNINGTTCYVAMDSDKDVTATFNLSAVTPDVASVSPTSGNWSSSPQNISVTSNNAAIIYYAIRTTTDGTIPADPPEPSATLNDGYISGSFGSYQVYASIGQNKKLKVRFRGENNGVYGATSSVYSYSINLTSAVQYTLSVSKLGTGSGTISAAGINCGTDCSESYNNGTSVTLTASSATDTNFAGWSGACSGTSTTCTVMMDAAKSVVAIFNSVGEPDITPPDTVIDSGPPTSTTSTMASFTFHATESGSTFECKLDTGNFAPCVSPQAYSGLAIVSHTFSVRAKDAVGNIDLTPATQNWDIIADTGSATISGHVWYVDGSGVDKIRVLASGTSADGTYIIGTTTTAVDGSYSIPLLLSGNYSVIVYNTCRQYQFPMLPNYNSCPPAGPYYEASENNVSVAGSTSQDFTLPPIVTLSGSVTDTSGTGVTDVSVFASGRAFGEYNSATTGADGSYSVPLYPGTYDVRLSFGDTNYTAATGVAVMANTVQNFTVSSQTTLFGHVWNDDGTGADKIRVYASGTSTDGTSISGSTTAAADGSYSIPLLQSGIYSITIDNFCDSSCPPDGPYYEASVNNAIVAGSTSQDFTLPPIVTLSGSVTDTSGTGVADVSVSASFVSSGVFGSNFATTGADGSYSLPLYPGTYEVRLSFGDTIYTAATGVAVMANTVQNFTVSSQTTLFGHVWNDDGTGADKIRVYASGTSTYGTYINGNGTTTTAADGSYSIPLLQSGTYSVTIDNTCSPAPPDYKSCPLAGPYYVASMNVSVAGNTSQDFTLPPIVTLSGSVTDTSGTGVADVSVFASSSDFVEYSSATTGADGSYSLPLYPGTYDVQLSFGDTSYSAATDVNIETSTAKDFTLFSP